MRTYSPTYIQLIDIIFRTKLISTTNSHSSFNGHAWRVSAGDGTNVRPAQDITISDTELYSKCTSAEWHLCGRILSELKMNNALWACPDEIKHNGTIRKAIAGLIVKDVLIKTETTNIYVVNPLHMRRGDFMPVISTTASLLYNASKVTTDHIVNKRAVKAFDIGSEYQYERTLQPSKPTIPKTT